MELHLKEEDTFIHALLYFPDAVSIADSISGEIIFVNESFVTNTGYNREEVIGKTSYQLNLWVDPDKRIELLNAIEKRIPFKDIELQFRRKTGDIIDCMVSAQIVSIQKRNYYLFFVRDITERIRIENAIRVSEARLRRAELASKCGNWELHMDTQKMVASEGSLRIYGVEENVMDFAIIKQVPLPEYRQMMDNALTELIQNNHPYDLEFKIRTLDTGEVKDIHSVAMYDRESRTLFGVIQDITDRKLAEEEIRRLNMELEKRVVERTLKLNEALADLESFAYSVSHDLRAPIRHINGFLHLLFDLEKDHSPEALDYFRKINLATHRMSVMIDSLLSFSRLGRKKLKMESIDLNQLVHVIIESFQPDIGDRKIRWKIADLPVICGDFELLKIAFENLLSNALKYTLYKEQAEIEIGYADVSPGLSELFIKDNGAGFNMDYSGKLFGVFQRLHSDSKFEGTGIGLANVKQIVEKHGGKVSAIGKENAGATFYISLPKFNESDTCE
jgi:PAS domain S-box-containing protein